MRVRPWSSIGTDPLLSLPFIRPQTVATALKTESAVSLLNLVLAKMDAQEEKAMDEGDGDRGNGNGKGKGKRSKFSAALADTLAIAYVQVRWAVGVLWCG